YDEIKDKIKNTFKNYRIIGKDHSGNYDLFLVELGNITKPKIMIVASMHGTEWQGTQYSMSILDMLENDNYPDKEFRDTLMENYHILYIPVVNPWGWDHITSPLAEASDVGRYNV